MIETKPVATKVKRGFESLSGLPDKLAKLQLSPFTTMICLFSFQVCYQDHQDLIQSGEAKSLEMMRTNKNLLINNSIKNVFVISLIRMRFVNFSTKIVPSLSGKNQNKNRRYVKEDDS